MELFGPQHTIHELMLSLFIKRHEALDEERKHELVGPKVGGPKSSTIIRGLFGPHHTIRRVVWWRPNSSTSEHYLSALSIS